jgi:hypothetical protein
MPPTFERGDIGHTRGIGKPWQDCSAFQIRSR